MPTIKTFTLGCKVNQYETEYVRQAIARIGYLDALPDEPADLCLINTCTVTAESDRKSRQRIRQVARANPDARIIVTGCMATRCPEKVAAMPGVTDIWTDKRRLNDYLRDSFGIDNPPEGLRQFGSRTRVFVKVQDGCQSFCTYCIIPHVRPYLTSQPIESVKQEVGRLVESGYREIVLTGIHLGHYGVDLSDEKKTPRANLASLVRELAEIDGDFRIRISSIEALEATEDLIGVMADYPKKICPHFHLSLQSGADSVLKRMGRPYQVDQFLKRCKLIYQSLDRPALTTDLIVGFPGETEADFQESCRTVEAARFSKIHIFRFSPREGTPAAAMQKEAVPIGVRRRRAAELARLAGRLRADYFESMLGRPIRTLVESLLPGADGRVIGTSDRYIPIELDGCEKSIGQFVQVTANRLGDDRLIFG
jgi:threonylcarbamoyladenosine tRNA methylthiotransferase MtaB